MSQVYQLSSFGTSPVTLAAMKTFMKITGASEDVLIQSLIDSATEFGEKYTGREFRANTWRLLLDDFSDTRNSRDAGHHLHNFVSTGIETERIELRRDPVDTITSITYLDDAGGTSTVPSADYYLKKLTQSSEVLLIGGKTYPSDVADREQAITILFVTTAYRCLNEIINAIKMHVANLYTNRGDCPDSKTAAISSGATLLYDQFRISRV